MQISFFLSGCTMYGTLLDIVSKIVASTSADGFPSLVATRSSPTWNIPSEINKRRATTDRKSASKNGTSSASYEALINQV